MELLYPQTEKLKSKITRELLLDVLEYSREYQTIGVTNQIDYIFGFTIVSYKVPEKVDCIRSLRVAELLQDLCTAEEFELKQTRTSIMQCITSLKGLGSVNKQSFDTLSDETKCQILTDGVRKLVAKVRDSGTHNVTFPVSNLNWCFLISLNRK